MRIKDALIVQRALLAIWLGILTGFSMIVACGGGGSSPSSASAPKGPAASISSPTGTYFKEGENIIFSGSATGTGGGELTGNAMVWKSNVDGRIGTGKTLITSALSAGDHEITLTASDSTGASTKATLPTISVAQTRFIKMGAQATGVTDASNAFDGDSDTAATIMAPDTEFIYFKAYIGIADTFVFGIKLGASTPGSRLAIMALTSNETWQPVSDIDLGSDKNVVEKINNAQNYKDTEGYINLRVRWEGGTSGDNALIYEIWRVDPPYAGSQTTGVANAGLAYDGDPSTSATITSPWVPGSNETFLHFKAYVGVGVSDGFRFKLSTASISEQTLLIDVEKLATPEPDDWDMGKASLYFSSTAGSVENTITIENAQDYLDEDGYISLRVRWVGYVSANEMKIHEISRTDNFMVGPKTVLDWKPGTEKSVDGDLNSYAAIFYHWGEADHHDFLHVQSYAGDSSDSIFSVKAALSAQGSGAELIVDGELEPDKWEEIQRISLDDPSTTTIELLNSRSYVNSEGLLSLRFRWVNNSPQIDYDAYIYEIWSETN